MKNSKVEFITKIIFFGSLWGFLEATLGYVLHFVPALISGSIMFPIVLLILYKAYASLGSRKAIFFVAMVAMMIKSVNLLLPFLHPARTINPMVAMFLEASLVFAIIPMLESDKLSVKVSSIVAASLVWRLAFVGYQGINFLATGFLAKYLESFSSAVSFIILEGLTGTVLALVAFLLLEKTYFLKKQEDFKISPLVSYSMLILAIIFTLTL
jgi:hypothetical protein